MTTITLTQLHTEGRLSLGDTLTHEHNGPHTLVNVMSNGDLLVKDHQGELHRWTLELPPGARIVPVHPPL